MQGRPFLPAHNLGSVGVPFVKSNGLSAFRGNLEVFLPRLPTMQIPKIPI